VHRAIATEQRPFNVQRKIEGLSMKKLFGAVCVLIVLAGINGCGSANDSLAKNHIQVTNELADALEKGADAAKLQEIQNRAKESTKKIEALPEAERKALEEKYKDELQKANSRVMAAMTKNVGKGVGEVKFPDFNGVTVKRSKKRS
jgi:biopolymer transport protein ExbB/TolQ